MALSESPVTGTTGPEPLASRAMAPESRLPPEPEGPAPSESPLTGMLPPLVFRATAPGGEIPPAPEDAAASTHEPQPGEPNLAGSLSGGLPEAGEVQQPSKPGPRPPLVLMRSAAGAEPVRPLTGSVAPLLTSAAGLRPVAIQAQRPDAPALVAAVAPRPFGGEPAPSGGARTELPMPAPRFAMPFTVQAMSLSAAPPAAEPATPTLAVPPPRTRDTEDAAVQRAGGFGHSLLEAAGSELGSARQAAETAGARELGTARQALQSAASPGLDAAQQAVHHAAGGAAGSTGSEADLDALAGRLYDHIRSRLRSELLIGRERAGQITDLR